MRKFVWVLTGFAALVFFSGCSTTKPASSPTQENRVQGMENKPEVLESNAPAPGTPGTEAGSMAAPASTLSGVTVQTMTKKQVQEALKNAGYYDGNIDGKFGPKTKAAVKQFQKDMGLKVDGVVGSKTKEKLLKYLK